MQTSTLRPGLLVSVKTSVRGNCKYRTTDIERDHVTPEGERVARWETERTITDPEEHERAISARSLARSAVQTVCAKSAFGLLCPEANADKLNAAIEKARFLCRAFNESASFTVVEFNVLVGRVSPDDVEAVRAINSEIRDLMDTMARGLQDLDVQRVRDAANKAKSVGKMLEPNAQERVEKALVIARAAAREIVKAGETGAAEIDQVSIQRLVEARTSFLDLDIEAEVQAPAAAAPVAVDFEPDADLPTADDVRGIMKTAPLAQIEVEVNEIARGAGKALEEAYPWGYRSTETEA